MLTTVLKGLALPFALVGQGTVWLSALAGKRAWKWVRGQKRAGTHGDAGFASLKQLEADGHLTPGGFLLGVQEGKRVFAKPEACVHFFAKRGEGKSQTMAANIAYLMELPKKPDFIINDPSGEHLQAFEAKLNAGGWDLLVLDLDNPAGNGFRQAKYNPLSALKNSTQYTYGRDVNALASLLVPDAGEHASSQHFIDAAHGVVAALVDWEYQKKGSSATIAETIRLLTTAREEERDAVIAQIALTGSETAKAGVNVFTRVKEREKGSFNSTLGRKLRLYNDPALAELMTPNSSPWTWEDVFTNPKPVGVFIVGGDGGLVAGAFNRLVMGQCIEAVERFRRIHKKPLPKGLRMFIDEANDLGACMPLQDAVTRQRKAGVNTFMCWQSVAQITTNYGGKDKAQPLIDGCDWIITGGLKDVSLYGQVETLLGDYTANSKSESQAEHGKSEGLHETARALRKKFELKSTPWGKAVVLADRLNVLVDLPFKLEGKGADRKPVYQ